MKISIFWIRRDLRLDDNTALLEALRSGFPVLCLFIFDSKILEELPANDPRVSFIYDSLEGIQLQLIQFGSSMELRKGDHTEIWKEVIAEREVAAVYVNRDYEPYAMERDRSVERLLSSRGIQLFQYKDQVIFEKDELLKKDGTPYTVFTPYKKKWLEAFHSQPTAPIKPPPTRNYLQHYKKIASRSELGLNTSPIEVKPYDLSMLNRYEEVRNFPALDITSHLSPHLRFGTVSIRMIVNSLPASEDIFLSELIWREFFMQILYHFPQVVGHNFKKKYNGILWLNSESNFEKWCLGETGYPLVDAGMRQLNKSGRMHNRVRMVTASFLCKHLLMDWRWGETYFAEKLLDYELSSNNGNWQWAAGTGCDAAPYFRIFNPQIQLKKFDKNLDYVLKWIPDYDAENYIEPIIEHRFARDRALKAYKHGLDNYIPAH